MTERERIWFEREVQGAVPFYIGLVERDEQVWKEAMHIQPSRICGGRTTYVDQDGVVIHECKEAELRESLSVAIRESFKQNTLRKRWKRAAMWGWGFVALLGVALRFVWTWGRA